MAERTAGHSNGQRATGPIFDAWSDEPWVIDGAAVRVSLVCFSAADGGVARDRCLDGETVDEIYTDLTARRGEVGLDLTQGRDGSPETWAWPSWATPRAAGSTFPGDLAREWLREPANPNGRPNSDVLKPWMNGMAITRRTDKWIVDFGWEMEEGDAALYEAPFQHIRERVHPKRQGNRPGGLPPQLVAACRATAGQCGRLSAGWPGTSRRPPSPSIASSYGLTPASAPITSLSSSPARDDTTFGILHSRFHEAWSLRRGYLARQRQRPALHSDHDL